MVGCVMEMHGVQDTKVHVQTVIFAVALEPTLQLWVQQDSEQVVQHVVAMDKQVLLVKRH